MSPREKDKVSPLGTSFPRSFSLSSPALLFIMYCCKSIYPKFTLSFGLLMISLFVLDKVLHSVVHGYFSNIFFAFNSLCYSLTSLPCFLFKNGRHLRVLVFHCLEWLSPSYLHGLHPHWLQIFVKSPPFSKTYPGHTFKL